MQALGFVRRIIGALAAGGMLAGCGGGTPWQSPAAVSPNVGTLMHAQAAEKYSTKKALLFQADEAEAAVNIYATGGLRHNPPPIATLHVAEGCPTGLAMDSSGTLYVADGVYINGDVEEYPKGSMKLKTTITDGVLGRRNDTPVGTRTRQAIKPIHRRSLCRRGVRGKSRLL